MENANGNWWQLSFDKSEFISDLKVKTLFVGPMLMQLHDVTTGQTRSIYKKFLSKKIWHFVYLLKIFSKFHVLFLIRNHHSSVAPFLHGTLHFLIPENIYQRIEQGNQDSVKCGCHLVKGENIRRLCLHKYAQDKGQNHNRNVSSTGVEGFLLPLNTMGSHRQWDDPTGNKKQEED